MKKIINNPSNVVSEMLLGLAKANPDVVYLGEGVEVIARKEKKQGKVGIISGGGSGHEPAHAGYVGKGMLDAAVAGNVFASPSPDRIVEGIKAADSGAGVLMVIKNYSGDIMNFTTSGEMAAIDGIKTDYVIVKDDVAVEDSTYSTGRRGIAGTVFVHKIAGAAAESGKSLPEVKAAAEKCIANIRSMGMAMSSCILPGVGTPGFTLGETEVEIGMGIHGEPGISRETISPAKDLAKKLLDKIFADTDIYNNSEVAVMINGLGGTPLMELYILNNEVQKILEEKGIKCYKTFVGNYMTALEMAGCSITLLKLDDELKGYLDYPSEAPAFRVEGTAASAAEAKLLSALREFVRTEAGEVKGRLPAAAAVKTVAAKAEAEAESTVAVEEEEDSPFTLTAQDYVNYVKLTAKKIAENEEYVSALDAATGDGDHWANINMGFEHLVAAGDDMAKMSISDVFKTIGMLMMSKIGGSSGILYGGAYMNAAKSCAGKAAIGSKGLCAALDAMVSDMMARGKAKPGMKTMIDALYPAVEAYKAAIAANTPIAETLEQVKKAAIDGAEATRDMECVKGRASYQANKGVGHLDAGAVTMSYQIECLCDYIAKNLI